MRRPLVLLALAAAAFATTSSPASADPDFCLDVRTVGTAIPNTSLGLTCVSGVYPYSIYCGTTWAGLYPDAGVEVVNCAPVIFPWGP